MAAVGEVVEVDRVDAVDHLPHQLAGLHVVVGALEHAAHHAGAIGPTPAGGQALQPREQLHVDEVEQGFACEAFRVGRPVAPAQGGGDRAGVVVVQLFEGLVLIVDDLGGIGTSLHQKNLWASCGSGSLPST